MIKEDYEKNGYVIIQNALESNKIDNFMEKHLELVNQITGKSFNGPNDPNLIEFYNEHQDIESKVYDSMLKQPWLTEFTKQKEITQPIKEILGNDIGVFSKVVFRMDLPNWTKEFAHWHQDFFYVKGNVNVVTLWIPMQDVRYIHGCLSVMPKTHLLGPIEHDLVIGKKNIPQNIFDNDIKLVEMNKGDILLFSALLLHSSNLNISDKVRYAVQPRYTPLIEEVDAGMGEVIPV